MNEVINQRAFPLGREASKLTHTSITEQVIAFECGGRTQILLLQLVHRSRDPSFHTRPYTPPRVRIGWLEFNRQSLMLSLCSCREE